MPRGLRSLPMTMALLVLVALCSAASTQTALLSSAFVPLRRLMPTWVRFAEVDEGRAAAVATVPKEWPEEPTRGQAPRYEDDDEDEEGGVERRRVTKGFMSAIPTLFELVMVGSDDPREDFQKVKDALHRQKACDLIFRDEAAVVTLPLMLAKLSHLQVLASPLPKTRFGKRRVRLFTGSQLMSAAPPDDFKVSAMTNASKLALSMRYAMGLTDFGDRKFDFERTLRMICRGKEAGKVVLNALDELYYNTQNEVLFTANWQPGDERNGIEFMIGFAETKAESQGELQLEAELRRMELQEASEEAEDADQEGTESSEALAQTQSTALTQPKLTLSKLLHRYNRPTVFQEFFVGSNISSNGAAIKISRHLEVNTVNAIDLILADKLGRPRLLRTIANLAEWTKAAGLIVGRRQGRLVVRVVKNARIANSDTQESKVFKVWKKTDPERMANLVYADLKKLDFGTCITLQSIGKGSREKAMMTIERLHWMTKREIVFKPELKEIEPEPGRKTMAIITRVMMN